MLKQKKMTNILYLLSFKQFFFSSEELKWNVLVSLHQVFARLILQVSTVEQIKHYCCSCIKGTNYAQM